MPKYIFLDRDGTIVADKHYLFRIEDLEFLPRATDGLKKLQKAGYKFIIVTNQAGVARNMYTLEDMQKFHDEMSRKLAEQGISIEEIYYCPHHPEFSGDCECRKPKPGLAKRAALKLRIGLASSFFIGDKDCDIELGKNCGGKTILISNGQYKTVSKPDFTVNNLDEAANIIINKD